MSKKKLSAMELKLKKLAVLINDKFATKTELQQATGTSVEPTSSATSMWNNYNIR